jgi:uncharacterized membrane protein YhdT
MSDLPSISRRISLALKGLAYFLLFEMAAMFLCSSQECFDFAVWAALICVPISLIVLAWIIQAAGDK